jgi:2-polyprenyl-6-methoxyphenol hydroxylase-like FAD-dependent oxidoreductase
VILDALVVGGGPAGSAAAICLAAAGLSVGMAARPEAAGEKLGESLSPAAGPLLRRLGVWEAFAGDGQLPCHANASAWGSAALAYHDFMSDPRGHGWHIDRVVLERRLIERAAALGVHVMRVPAPLRWSREDGVWKSPPGRDLPALSARWIVDATGRAAWFARTQGARTITAWDQVALAAIARTAEDTVPLPTLIEAVPAGFWYSAPLPGRRMVLALFTDAQLQDARAASTVEGFLDLLRATTHTAKRFSSAEAALAGRPRFLPAGSGRLSRVSGEGWIAAGDAAMTYDPISAHGVTLALRTGIDAAAALLDGRDEALAAYAAVLDRAFARYRREALRIYRSEGRWPHEPYWAARHALAAAEPV